MKRGIVFLGFIMSESVSYNWFPSAMCTWANLWPPTKN